jgi:glycine cleavage system transcriptional repressor
MKNKSFFTISGITSQKNNAIPKIISFFDAYETNVDKMQMTDCGVDIAFFILASGRWDAICRLEQAVASLNNGTNTSLVLKRTEESDVEDQCFIPYYLSLTTVDDPGILNKVVNFCEFQEIAIGGVSAVPFVSLQGLEMSRLKVLLKVPMDLHLASLREEFNIFCDNENIDATLEAAH